MKRGRVKKTDRDLVFPLPQQWDGMFRSHMLTHLVFSRSTGATIQVPRAKAPTRVTAPPLSPKSTSGWLSRAGVYRVRNKDAISRKNVYYESHSPNPIEPIRCGSASIVSSFLNPVGSLLPDRLPNVVRLLLSSFAPSFLKEWEKRTQGGLGQTGSHSIAS